MDDFLSCNIQLKATVLSVPVALFIMYNGDLKFENVDGILTCCPHSYEIKLLSSQYLLHCFQ